jgi:hypothetical protein
MSDMIVQLNRQVAGLCEQGRFESAVPLARQSLRLARRETVVKLVENTRGGATTGALVGGAAGATLAVVVTLIDAFMNAEQRLGRPTAPLQRRQK